MTPSRFPRRIRRGLIEASFALRRFEYPPDFRGEFAAASLKHNNIAGKGIDTA